MTEVAPPPPRPAAGDVHRVAAGEALSRIARRYGVATKELAAANGITPPYTITVGQTLRIPDRGTATAKAMRPPGPAPERPATTARYVVQNGDALIRIARRFDVPAASIARANEIRPPYRLRVGQTLTIPGTDVAVTDDERSGRGTARATGGEPDVLSGKGFLWPVSGNVISHFGESDNGQRRQGIAIAARMGAPVRAVEAGTVVYAGDAIRGYGRMILIRHADGYVSAYAHNSALLVNVGETVDRGQVIARVGASGGVSRAQLHFELRKGRKPIDPETVLVRDSTEVASSE